MSVQVPLLSAMVSSKPSGMRMPVEQLVAEGFDLDRFAQNFETLSEASGGVAHLRGMILNLAVRGKLVRQVAADGAASGDCSPVDVGLFELPVSWGWTTIGEVFEVVGGIQKTPLRAPKANHYPYLRVENVQRGRLDLSRLERFELQPGELERKRLVAGDLLVVEGNGSETEIGRCAVWDGSIENCVHQNHIIRCRALGTLESQFVLLFLNSPSGMHEMKQLAITTSGLHSLSVGKIRGIKVPVPPLAEQKRIVARVDQLMALIDDLEAKQTKKRDLSTRFTKASLEALTTAEESEDFDGAWTRVVENFPTMLDSAEKVGALRRTVRDLAVSGRLVGELGRSDSIDRRSDGPFLIPGRWQWRPLGKLIDGTAYGTSQKAHEEPDGVPVLRMNNIQDGRLDLSSLKYVPKNTEKLDELMLARGDLLFNRTNSHELVGKMCVFRDNEAYTFASYLIRVRPSPAVAVSEYINLYFASAVCRRTQIEPHITVQTNQANFNGTKLKDVLVPCPPVEEQARIVAKVEHLMRLCDDLEAKLRRAEHRASKLVEAVVQEMVA